MACNFITNSEGQQTLKERINTIISRSDELKFLVGFFYFNAWGEIYKSLEKNPNQRLKILVGLQVSHHLENIIEFADNNNKEKSNAEIFQEYLDSLGFALNSKEMDREELYTQVEFFIKLIEEKRLEIRRTEKPNHAKLYLFKYDEEEVKNSNSKGQLITGSSNLTRAGLSGQDEFNVEIRDYGFPEASSYFDELWEKAISITSDENRKVLIEFIRNKTQVTTVSPFEAYCLVLKTYLDTKNEGEEVDLDYYLEKNDLKKFSYQIDAVKEAIQKLKEHNGCIIADVVGLGKSVIASMVAKQLNKRGLIICPPGLMGDKDKKDSGWWEYLETFELHNWQVFSRGKLDQIAEDIYGRGFEVVIIDEAHYFRNQDTNDYGDLEKICKGKKVILLTATPFNNSPADIFALLRLFIVPGKSTISYDDNLEGIFASYNTRYKHLGEIMKNHNSSDESKRKKAEKLYKSMVDDKLPVDTKRVNQETKNLSNEIKRTIDPVVIRRNRLDLLQDYTYSKEVGELSKVKDPEEIFYYLDEDQNEFYDKIIKQYFGQNGEFAGAIYQPFSYEKIINEEKLDEKGNRQFNQQKNLYDFMRRILVKRFESSFGSFEKSIDRFLSVHILVKNFIEKTGKYILDRKLIERIENYDIEDIAEILEKYAKDELPRQTPKNTNVYQINKFERKEEFLNDIENDIKIFTEIQRRLKELKLVDNDPKQEEIIKKIKQSLEKEPDRKIILFSEYVDTILHLEKKFKEEFKGEVLVCDGSISKDLAEKLNSDFNAQYNKGLKTDNFKILLTSDKLSEGFNLNCAGIIINYDIPWNPTRVIQRVGRINRIGTKVFDELFIWNFFPSIRGAEVVNSRTIAEQKMFLIHNALGEDTKIFSGDETPTPANINKKQKQAIEGEDEGINTITKIRNLYADIEKKYPKVIKKINNLPSRVKTAKKHSIYELNVLHRKGMNLFPQVISKGDKREVREIGFEEFLSKIECEFNTPKFKLSSVFWGLYDEVKNYKKSFSNPRSENSLETRAMGNLKKSLKLLKSSEYSDLLPFINILIRDMKEYKTLSTSTLRNIGEKDLTEKNINTFVEKIEKIKKYFGENYLDDIDERDRKNKDIIIAIENNDLKELIN